MNAVSGITVSTKVKVTDYAAFGDYIAGASNADQTEFLAGLATGFQSFDTVSNFTGLMQMEYIREAVGGHNERKAIRWFIAELNERLNGDEN